ncbi:MAG: hypothetical protein Q4E26_00755 [Prevotellaceae bacterium]|nr:hypothetical protein [Prevotellaceae bacterium]
MTIKIQEHQRKGIQSARSAKVPLGTFKQIPIINKVYVENNEKVPHGTLALLALSITDYTFSTQMGINDFSGSLDKSVPTVPLCQVA